MKILLDECLPLDYRHSFPEHEAHTAEWAGFKGKKNGDLLRSAQAAGYQVLVTVDQGMPYQQASGDRTISILLICSRTNQLEDLRPLAIAVLQASSVIEPGQVRSIQPPD